MPVRSHVEVVRRIPLQVHPTRVPVTLFGHALRGPVRPDPELRVAEPVWRDVLFERFPRGLKRTGGDGPRLPKRGGCRCIAESARSKCEGERGRESLHQSTASEHDVPPWIQNHRTAAAGEGTADPKGFFFPGRPSRTGGRT